MILMWYGNVIPDGMGMSYQMEWECHTYVVWECHTRWNGNVIPMWYGNVIPDGMGIPYTSVTHLDQAISLDIFVKTCVILGPLGIYFFCLGKKIYYCIG